MSHCLQTTLLITLLVQLASGCGSDRTPRKLPPAAATPYNGQRAPFANTPALPRPEPQAIPDLGGLPLHLPEALEARPLELP